MKTVKILIRLAVTLNMLYILPYIYAQELKSQDIYSSVSPAMMVLKAYDPDSSLNSSGSAVAIGDDGIVFTNMHIFKDSKWMELTAGDITIRDIKILGFDPDNDILILKIPAGIIRGIKTANSDSVKIGEPVFAIGNPLGFNNTFSNGILSGIRQAENTQLQFTASISPGSSGGALVDSKGELIGITASYYKNGQNINFAVPVNYFVNTDIADADDTGKVNLFKDIVEIYNSETDLSPEETKSRLSAFKEDSVDNRNALYTVAKIYDDLKFIDLTIDVCNNALSKFPMDKRFYLLRGEEYSSKKISESAIADFNKALEIDSVYESALMYRGYFNRYAGKNPRAALKDFHKLASLRPGNEFMYLDAAEVYLELKDSAAALADLQRSYSSGNFTAATYYERGRIFSDLKKYDAAIADFTSAISLNSECVDYYFSRAVAYSKLDNHNNALSDYFSVMSFNPHNVLAINNLAYEYFNLEDYDKAEENFIKALRIDDNHFDSYIGLAITARKLNKTNECLRSMYKAIQLSPALEHGIAGLDSLKKDGYFWSGNELRSIKDVFVIMRIEDSDLFAMYDDSDQATGSEPNPRPHKMARRVK